MQRSFGALNLALLIAIAAVIVYQTQYLFFYPQIDTGAWFGDESWTMLTLREVAQHGVARIPEAIGSSIAENNGFVNGVVWVSGVIYGLPALLLTSVASPVAIGRVVTLLASLWLLLALYRLLTRIGVSRSIALSATLALVASPVFYFSSHSARLDTITALAAVIALMLYMRLEGGSTHRYFWTGFVTAASLMVYVHVPTLIVLPWLAAIALTRDSVRKWLSSAFGAASAAALMLMLYVASTHHLTLLGSGHNQYYSVANALPVLHPFSWQVQKINTIDRFPQVWQTQWPIVVALAVGIVGLFLRPPRLHRDQRTLLVVSLLVIVGWMLFEGPAVFYEIHAAPIFALIAALLLSQIRDVRVVAFAALIVAGVAVWQQRGYGEAGSILSANNEHAVHALLSQIDTAGSPIVLADQPAWNCVAATTGVRLMTSHLLLFGRDGQSVTNVLRQNNVHYLLLYSTTHFQSPFRPIADSLYAVAGVRIGMLTDESKAYDPDAWTTPDTLRLYKARFE